MDKNYISKILEEVKDNKISIDEALKIIEELPYSDLNYAKIDNHREIRTGYPEVIFCQGKKTDHIVGITEKMLASGEKNILGTRAEKEVYNSLKEKYDNVKYFEDAKILLINEKPIPITETSILVVSAGTADHSVAEEAAVTAECFGNRVERLYDVGVAGIHRLLSNLENIYNAKVIICVAGMDAALLSVVGGLAKVPVIGVPTSVGYGASFNGVSALLSMLNSCASGTATVNIDNGFGAAYIASMINKQ